MDNVKTLLDAIRDFEFRNYDAEKKYDIENGFRKELDKIIAEEYDGNFIKFMNDWLFTQEYIDIRFEVERICEQRLF